MKINHILFVIAIFSLTGYTQNPKEDWVTYIEQKKKGSMVKQVNLYYDYARPNYKNLLVVGTSTFSCFKNGYPKTIGLSKFYRFSDSIASTLNRLTKNRLVGVLTYRCAGFDVYYLKDTTNVKNTIQSFLKANYASSKNYVLLEYDKKWNYYKEQLFPKDISDNFFVNHEFLNQLVIEGDDISKPRKINHWISFRREKRSNQFIEQVKKLEFAIDSVKFNSAKSQKFELKISRKEAPLPDAISKLTSLLRSLAISSYGIYEGWGTEPVKED